MQQLYRMVGIYSGWTWGIYWVRRRTFIDADDLTGEWDPQHLVGIHPKGFMTGFGAANSWPRPLRLGTPDRDLTKTYWLYRVFITPQIFRFYIDDDLVLEVPGHDCGKTMKPWKVQLQMAIAGFYNASSDGAGFTHAFSPSVDLDGASRIDRDMKIDYYLRSTRNRHRMLPFRMARSRGGSFW
jgi:hypothetical protein